MSVSVDEVGGYNFIGNGLFTPSRFLYMMHSELNCVGKLRRTCVSVIKDSTQELALLH